MAVMLGMMASRLPWAPIVAFMLAWPLSSPQQVVYSAGLFGWPFALTLFMSSILLGLAGGFAAMALERKGWVAEKARFRPIAEGSATNSSSTPSPTRKVAKPRPRAIKFAIETAKTGKRLLVFFVGFAFLGYFLNNLHKRGSQGLRFPAAKIRSGVRSGDLYAYPTQKSVDRFKEAIRRKTRRRIPLRAAELIRELNPVIRGWGEYYKPAHVRRLFNQLDRWVVRRLWSHRHKRWRCTGWKTLPTRPLRGELGLASLVSLIPSLLLWPCAALS